MHGAPGRASTTNGRSKMNKRQFLSIAAAATVPVLSACSTTGTGAGSSDPATKRAAIDSGVDNALSMLYGQAGSSREMVSKAKGVLVFPAVVSAGFVIGGSHGEGALRVGGKTNGYYSTTAGSVGLLAGAQSKAVYMLFMTEDALAKFQKSQGWTAGVDAAVTLIDVSADARVNTATAQQPVVGYVVANGGLMANLSFDGTKITRLEI
jgi:lipid-binding SYLF domain-containing protein